MLGLCLLDSRSITLTCIMGWGKQKKGHQVSYMIIVEMWYVCINSFFLSLLGLLLVCRSSNYIFLHYTISMIVAILSPCNLFLFFFLGFGFFHYLFTLLLYEWKSVCGGHHHTFGGHFTSSSSSSSYAPMMIMVHYNRGKNEEK